MKTIWLLQNSSNSLNFHGIVRHQGFNVLILFLAGITVAYIVFPLVSILTFVEPSRFLDSLTRPELWDAFVLSLISATISTFLLALFGIPLAYFLARYTHFHQQVCHQSNSYYPTCSSSTCKWCSSIGYVWSKLYSDTIFARS